MSATAIVTALFLAVLNGALCDFELKAVFEKTADAYASDLETRVRPDKIASTCRNSPHIRVLSAQNVATLRYLGR